MKIFQVLEFSEWQGKLLAVNRQFCEIFFTERPSGEKPKHWNLRELLESKHLILMALACKAKEGRGDLRFQVGLWLGIDKYWEN